jgi:hypothetical protein
MEWKTAIINANSVARKKPKRAALNLWERKLISLADVFRRDDRSRIVNKKSLREKCTSWKEAIKLAMGLERMSASAQKFSKWKKKLIVINLGVWKQSQHGVRLKRFCNNSSIDAR